MESCKERIERFKAEHRVAGYVTNGNYSISFWIDGARYHLEPQYEGSSLMACNYPSGFSVYRKRRGVEREYLFTFFEYVNDESTAETVQYVKMRDELWKEKPMISPEDYTPYIIWHIAQDMK